MNHVSQGENEQRHIIISKLNPSTLPNKQVSNKNTNEDSVEELREDVIKDKNQSSGTSQKVKATNKENPQGKQPSKIKDSSLHSVSDDDTNDSVQDTNEDSVKELQDVIKETNQNSGTSQKVKAINTKKRQSKKPSKVKAALQSVSENNDDDDFDALLAAVVKADKTCSSDKCKKSVAVLSQICQFCKGHFCFSHFIPEAHGCGHLAKLQARSQIRKDGKLYPGSGKPLKKVDAIKHSYLQKKLNEKISSLNSERKAKPKG